MPKLVIDNLEVEVPKGTKVIDAAERLGIVIPRFCYLKVLGAVGACRMCAVKFLEGSFKGVQMSCMIDAQDGMVVSTTDEEAVDFRRHVIEWLMMNHPHDCPVCDEGGQCLLQDLTVSGGHGIRRYKGRKRTYVDQYLGPFIKHEMNRCIQCYRCSRFYQEYAGYRDLGVMQIGDRVFFGRFSDGQLESPFAGNLVDICPTGVYTDIPARYKVRRWELERSLSICIHCSLGCNTVANVRYREAIRIEARANDEVNGMFICDRGRFGFSYANHPERPRRARVDSREVSWDEAVRAAADRLVRIRGESGPEAIACLGSARSSLEAQSMLKGLCRVMNWPEPVYFVDSGIQRKTRDAALRLDSRLAVSMSEIEHADFIIVVGADPVNEAPVLTLAMRQASRNGAPIVVIDPRPVSLPFDFKHIAVMPEGMDACASALVKNALRREDVEKTGETALQFFDGLPDRFGADGQIESEIAALASRLEKSRRPVIVCGTDIVPESTPNIAADHVLLLKGSKEDTGIFYILQGANAFGGALLSPAGGRSFLDILEGIENGAVRALIAVESDLLHRFPDRKRLEKAFDKLDFLLVLDYLPFGLSRYAHVLLPTSTLFESRLAFINQEGRAQTAEPAHSGGIPIAQTGGGSHPPRLYGTGLPGADHRAAWRAIVELARAMNVPAAEMPEDAPLTHIARECPVLRKFGRESLPVEGLRVIPEQSEGRAFGQRTAQCPAAESRGPEMRGSESHDPEGRGRTGDDLDLLLVDWTFGTEELSSYSEHIQEAEKEPVLSMHPVDASRAGLSEGERVALRLNGQTSLEVTLAVLENMAPGTMVLPRHHRICWQGVKSSRVRVRLGSVVRVRSKE